MAPPKSLVIIPTFNEKENIGLLIPEIDKAVPGIDILVVDDSSPDGTSAYVKELGQKRGRLFVLDRLKKEGLGKAYVAGFHWALERDYEYIFEMDADYSHDPKEITNFLKAAQKYDLVLGSRYIDGVNVVNWPMKRLLLSYFANIYTRLITGLPIKDATGGYKCFKRKVLEAIDFNDVKSNGYAFQIEITYKAWRKGFKIGEMPIVFVDRTMGHSKMSKKIVREAVFMVWKLRIRSILGNS